MNNSGTIYNNNRQQVLFIAREDPVQNIFIVANLITLIILRTIGLDKFVSRV
jgi:hypothetical protein